jgi:ornithine cyclodeaminase
MRIVSLAEITAALDEGIDMAAVAQSFVDFTRGAVQNMAVGHLRFASSDCHVKGGGVEGAPFFTVKVANDAVIDGATVAHGVVVLCSTVTGKVVALLQDEGQLTAIRTALASAIGARAIARPGARTLGIVGTGNQARLNAQVVARMLGLETILIWGRDAAKAQALAQAVGGQVSTLEQVCAADIIVTSTTAKTPILTRAMVPAGARIIAMGADAPGKQELETALVASAKVICDSKEQCIDHGECGWAVREGLLPASALLELGEVLATSQTFGAQDTVIVDLTGLGAQDHAIASSVWSRLG